jgi:hypothetical protein
MAYIKLEDAIKKVDSLRCECDAHFYGEALTDVKSELLAMYTADVVEVVRCKDCLYYTPIPWNKEEMVCRCYTDWLFTEPTDFCSNGERKEE